MIDASVQEIANGIATSDGKATKELIRLLQALIDALNDHEERIEALEP